MTQPVPKFSVGEEVYFYSKVNGCWKVGIITRSEFVKRWRPDNFPDLCYENIWRYGLGAGCCPESEVRKKHPPATQSFTELMQSLNSKVSV